ncbi:cytochrome P450 [Blastococcus sp. SYSU D00820]
MSDDDVYYDPFDARTLADPVAAHRQLRERCPVHHHPGFGERGFYTLSRHDDVREFYRDWELWSSEWGQAPIYVKEGGLKSDPPEHTIYRKPVVEAFSARRTAAMEPLVTAAVDELLDAIEPAPDGSFDLGRALAVPLPMIVICQVLGIPVEDRDLFTEWCNAFMAAQNVGDAAVQGAARAKIDAYMTGVLADRRAQLAAEEAGGPPAADDMLNSLIRAEHDGERFTDEQLLPLLLLLLVGGSETSTSLITSLVMRLLEHGLWERVRDDRRLVEVAIEETLRFDPPVMGVFRTNTRPVTMHGVTIPEQSKVHGLYASANRDAAVWDDSDSFRLDRDVTHLRRTHLSFGVGQYLCPAAALARMEARISLERLLDRFPRLVLTGVPERTESFMMWGHKTLPVGTAPR